ncbi:MDR family MFS transporter [Evansella cellulosilytica]|uniref:Drug resistance transporter, EmrB/QacA subfamily n=1 Tax=Evansella cellulosilytica (strain ATCC 21833 / DSM 2522 / FERM P-1141 / JCM 9156 / N-4) TaxID=649639 RepID=E6TQM1_EVAC2|nr:MDR family MFS transporter [Evansella cellulosilytica]ADU30532.1 drug resistance transporter, EmrB/QacA subfamily [Evansella cellulosilytica DSM 2522]
MDRYQRNIIIALLIATFLAAIEVTVISTAMPVITRDLGGLDLISWVFAIYLLTYAVMTPIFGKLADLFGRKKIFIIGATLFLIGSGLCGLSQSMEQLIFFRAIQGIGAGALMPMSFTIVGDVFKYEQRGKVQAILGSIWGIAGICGPLVGGFFVDYFTWHWIFYINIPFGIISMYLIGKYLEEKIEKRKRKIDYGGAVTFIIGMGALLYALLSGGNEIAWNDSAMIALIIIACLFLFIFVWIQIKVSEPMLPFRLFKNRYLLIANVSGFLLGMILIGLTAYLPLWVQGVLLLAATSSGLTLIPMSIGWPLGSFLSGRFLVKLGTKLISLTGVIVISLGTFGLTFIHSGTPNIILIIIMFFIGLGFGLSMTVFTVIVQSSVSWNNRGTAASSNAFLRTLGQTLGITILGVVLNQHIGGQTNNGTDVAPALLAAGLHNIFIILAVIALICVVVTCLLPKEQPDFTENDSNERKEADTKG